MPNNVKLIKLLEEIRGFAEMSQRRSQSKPPGLVLVQLRSTFKQTCRRKLRIPIQMKELPDIPSLVKINYIKSQTLDASP